MERIETETRGAGAGGVAGAAGGGGVAGAAGGGRVRRFARRDVAAVAALFQKTFRDARVPAPQSLARHLDEVFLQHPWAEPDIGAQVYQDRDGMVRGFIGVVPARMVFRGRRIRAAIAGSLMVDRPADHPLAGARLVRAFLSGPQDLSVTETANPVSTSLWQRAGHRPEPVHSLSWLRVLRPAGFAAAMLSERFAPARVFSPVAALADRFAQRFGLVAEGFGSAARKTYRDADAGDAELTGALLDMAGHHALRPDWNEDVLAWVLGHARHKARHGRFIARTVSSRSGRLLGCYVYYTRPAGIAWVLQALATPEGAEATVDSLFSHAWSTGSVAIRGRNHPRLTDALMRRKAFFFWRSSVIAHAGDADIAAAIGRGDALITGLGGETWMRLVGDHFV